MLFSYIKDKLKPIIMCLLFAVICAVVFYLYKVPVEVVVYAALLCVVLAFIYAIYDFYKYRKTHFELSTMINSLVTAAERLPYTKNLIESDYQSIVTGLFSEYKKLTLKADTARIEMMDYYILWVHQIKTPISAMRLLIQEDNSADSARLLHELFKVERYVELALQYQRLESITADLKLQKYSLDSIVRQAARKYAPMFVHKKIKLEVDVGDTTVLTDEKWLVFVIEQILSNSLKYTNQGYIKIYSTNGSELVIEDTGIGIAAEDLPRLFERGFTGFTGRMDKKSTGLGLYLCQKILYTLSHKISITSKLDEGTKVILGLDSCDTFIE